MQIGVELAQSESEEAALGRWLAAQPNSVMAHVRMAELRTREQKENLARYYYRKALQLAECQEELSEDTKSELTRAQSVLAALNERTYTDRETSLAERGYPPDTWSPRFRQSMEIAAGRRKNYGQEPTEFDYPGLAAIPFFDPADFSWAAEIEAATPVIRDELVRDLDRGRSDFRAYVQGHSVVEQANTALRGKDAWSVLPLWERGWAAQKIVERFPRTAELIRRAPLPAIYGWGPTVVFSLLEAGAHIPAHTGMFNTRLICHLPLIVPPSCRFRVGNETREWEEGKLLIFDDTIEHEAWNDGAEDRIVLIFDIWRPELSEREREELTALFHA
jgi:hypothetical protein